MATIGAPSGPSLLCCKLDQIAEQLKVLNTNGFGFGILSLSLATEPTSYKSPFISFQKNKLSDGQVTVHMQNSFLRSKTRQSKFPFFSSVGVGGRDTECVCSKGAEIPDSATNGSCCFSQLFQSCDDLRVSKSAVSVGHPSTTSPPPPPPAISPQ